MNDSAYLQLNLPLASHSKLKPIRIAILDDGFSMEHSFLKGIFAINEKEKPFNGIDDDGNGWVDDVNGWDVSDVDSDPGVSFEMGNDYFHGTMVAGIIKKVFQIVLESKTEEMLEIIPIKIRSDKDREGLVKEGYLGLKYAVSIQPDIICLAWSGGELTIEAKKLLQDANNKGIIVVAASGNEYSKVLPPANYSTTIAVSAITLERSKTENSNYGKEVDFVAFGEKVKSAHASNRKGYFYGEGTSSATAQVAGVIGVLKCLFPTLSQVELVAALKNTAVPVDSSNRKYVGLLGAGIPNLSAAIKYINDKRNCNPEVGMQGIVQLSSKKNSFEIKAPEYIDKIELKILQQNGQTNKQEIVVHSINRSVKLESSTLMNSFPINLHFKGKGNVFISYQLIPVDSSTLYCKDQIELKLTESIVLTDGSVKENYAPNSSCQWLIKTEAGRKIQLSTKWMNTEPNVDNVLVFSGNSAQQKNLVAKFSGTKIPPVITIPHSEILIWFLSNESIQGNGWEIECISVE